MFLNQYGSRNDPAIILLAPVMVSGSDLYNLMKPYFKGNHHIIAPDQGRHACRHYDLGRPAEVEQEKLNPDFDWMYSRKTIPMYMPKAGLVIRPGYRCCGRMAAETKACVEQIEASM